MFDDAGGGSQSCVLLSLLCVRGEEAPYNSGPESAIAPLLHAGDRRMELGKLFCGTVLPLDGLSLLVGLA